MRIRHVAQLPVLAPTVVVAMLGGALASSTAAAQGLQSTASDGVVEGASSTEESRPTSSLPRILRKRSIRQLAL
jgi:hypothetical protein